MLKYLKNSFAYRSAILYKRLLILFKNSKLSKSTNFNYTLASLCGASHEDMLIESILSINNAWDVLPNIIIYSDGTSELKKLKTRFASSTSSLKILSITALLDDLALEEKYTNLVAFGNSHVIGKKLAIIVKHALQGPVIWCDTDILWFQNFSFENSYDATAEFFIKTSEDYQAAYSKNIVNLKPQLNTSPFINTGVVLMRGDIFSIPDIDLLIREAALQPDHFSEQTILAYAVKVTKSEVFSLEQIACSQADGQTLSPTFLNKRWIARHYVGPVRHLFWRDAFFLCIKSK